MLLTCNEVCLSIFASFLLFQLRNHSADFDEIHVDINRMSLIPILKYRILIRSDDVKHDANGAIEIPDSSDAYVTWLCLLNTSRCSSFHNQSNLES
jgi:hypothetical protein